MRVVRIEAGRVAPGDAVGAILTRDLAVGGERWAKGRRLSAADLASLPTAVTPGMPLVLVVPDDGDVHEDDAARRLARAVAGPGLVASEPRESRVDLRAAAAGIVRVDVARLARLDRIDPLEVFTVHDCRVVEAGALVASVKIGPHLVADDVLLRAEGVARLAGHRGIVSVAPFRPRRVAAIVKENVRGVARERFESSVRAKVVGLGSELVGIDYVDDDPASVAVALARRAGTGWRRGARGRGGHEPQPEVRARPGGDEPGSVRRVDPGGSARDGMAADLVLTAGSASTDPEDAFFVALLGLGGIVVRHGVPAHPGSMLWLARIGRVPVLGLPSCGAYSRATAADLLLPLLLAGEPASAYTVARLGHGGILTRDQHHRFPGYARDLEAPGG